MPDDPMYTSDRERYFRTASLQKKASTMDKLSTPGRDPDPQIPDHIRFALNVQSLRRAQVLKLQSAYLMAAEIDDAVRWIFREL